ncbi:MAG: hypothetical protein JWO60_1560 [Frankiales bacterium]|nr:hypothetical protein [Frankiales bacterium]
MAASGSAEKTARDVHQSGAVDGLARVGLASRGLVWLVIGLLGVSVLRGQQARTDQQGALRVIADKPFGEVLLVVLVVGFLGYALWQALNAAVGQEKASKRLQAAGKALLYAFLALTVVRFLAAEQQSKGDATTSVTARLMEQPGGRVLVGVAGAVVVALGGYLLSRALKGSHAKKIEGWKVPDGRARQAVRLGTVGLGGRGLVVALVGAFLVSAAVQADPKKAKGLDAALQSLAEQPFGKVLLGLAVLALLAYAAWSFVEAAFHRHDSSAA